MPVSYPVFPLTPNYGNSYSTKADTNKSQYNEGGAILRGLIGINPLSKTFKFSVGTAKIDTTESFLNANIGNPFRLSFDGGATVETEIYRLTSYKWQFYDTQTRGLSTEMQQIRRFR